VNTEIARLTEPAADRPSQRHRLSDQESTGSMSSSSAAFSREWPANTMLSSSTMITPMKPAALMLFAICRICFFLGVRGCFEGWPEDRFEGVERSVHCRFRRGAAACFR
jgi:hypothetical protein